MRSLADLRAAETATLQAAGLAAPPDRHADPGNQDWSPVVVKVKLAGGSAGGPTTSCTFTYDVWRAEASTAVISAPTPEQITTLRLATARIPEKARAARGLYTAAETGSFGEAVFDLAAGQWVLLVAWREREGANLCDQP